MNDPYLGRPTDPTHPPDEFYPAHRWRCIYRGRLVIESGDQHEVRKRCPKGGVIQRLYERTTYDHRQFWR